MSRQRMQAPNLPGFEYDRWLGGGGFADVFLYRQLHPAREVAIKVLLDRAETAEAKAGFDDEADLMARVSAHPYIVTIHSADVSPDGRPYLVMEYYPGEHYGLRARRARLPVAEVLRVGIQVASAVETAHRVGIIHRDIKPANILVSDYGRPGLTDFGIAGARTSRTEGMSVPYAATEVLSQESPGDELSDVYSLGATVYALLAGRSPFEITGTSNPTNEMLSRALSALVPPIGRPDLPRSVDHLLVQAMSKRPALRPQSMAAMAQALGDIERELHLAPTPFEVRADKTSVKRTDQPQDDADGTRAGHIQVVQQAQPERRLVETTDSTATAPRAPVFVAPPVRHEVFAEEPPAYVEDTVAKALRLDRQLDVAPAGRSGWRQSRWAVAGGAVVLVVVMIAVVTAMMGGHSHGAPGPSSSVPSDGSATSPTIVQIPLPPAHVTVTVAGGVATVTWSVSDSQVGDTYKVTRDDGSHRDDPYVTAPKSPYALSGIQAGEQPCFVVATVRGNNQSDNSPPACAS